VAVQPRGERTNLDYPSKLSSASERVDVTIVRATMATLFAQLASRRRSRLGSPTPAHRWRVAINLGEIEDATQLHGPHRARATGPRARELRITPPSLSSARKHIGVMIMRAMMGRCSRSSPARVPPRGSRLAARRRPTADRRHISAKLNAFLGAGTSQTTSRLCNRAASARTLDHPSKLSSARERVDVTIMRATMATLFA
jgi:hypothetical protein